MSGRMQFFVPWSTMGHSSCAVRPGSVLANPVLLGPVLLGPLLLKPLALGPLLLGAVLLGGCAAAGPVGRGAAKVPESPAPHLRAAALDEDPSGLVQHTDPLPEPASKSEVSLGGILVYADQYSPVLAVARSTRSRAEAARLAASPWLTANPELTIAVGPRMGSAGRGLDIQASLTQEIQIAGERGLRIEAADRLRELTDAEIEQMRWFVHCDVHAAFHRALVEQQRLRLAEHVVAFQREVLRFAERQIAAGEVAPLTLRIAQAEVAQAEQVLVSADQAFFASRLRLAQLSGWPVSKPPMPEGQVDEPREPASDAQLLAVARQRLPSLRAASARIQEARARTSLADREAWPKPSLGVQYSREGNPTAEGADDIVMGVVSVPIISFQRNQAESAQARADQRVAEAEFDAASRLLEGQIAEARSEVIAAAKRTRAYGTEVLPRFEENLTLLKRAFELGEIDILALSTGRERFLRIQSDALAAQLDYFFALAGLERVVGVDLWRDDHHEETP
jgi:cobalt-zinc-cadmium efflux system outer membrane protein